MNFKLVYPKTGDTAEIDTSIQENGKIKIAGENVNFVRVLNSILNKNYYVTHRDMTTSLKKVYGEDCIIKNNLGVYEILKYKDSYINYFIETMCPLYQFEIYKEDFNG